jgi:hypothetical protein
VQFGSVEMATLEQGDGHFELPRLTSVERELFSAIGHRTHSTKPILFTTNLSGNFSVNDNPSPTTGTGHARAQNTIRHS